MKPFFKFKHFIIALDSNYPYLRYVVLFLIAFLFFFILQYNPYFADPDSFYHTKIALLIKEKGIIKEFPWLQYTVLKEHYTDHHFLYHLFLVPFVTFLNPIVGVKLATALINAFLILIIYHLMRFLGFRIAGFLSLLLLVINPFIFRLSLVKAPGFSLIILFLGLYLIFTRHLKWLFILSFFYVWAYGGFFLIVILAGFLFLTQIIRCVIFKFKHKKNRKDIFKKVIELPEFKALMVSLIGVIAGLIINPYFPDNLFFYWHQVIKIGIINYSKIIRVGGEWYPYKPIELLVTHTPLLTALLILCLVVILLEAKKQTFKNIGFFLMFLFFLILTLKSRRYVEYYVPFAVLFTGSVLSDYLKDKDIKIYWQRFIKFFIKYTILVSALLTYLAFCVTYIIFRDVAQVYKQLNQGFSFNTLSSSSQWLANNSPPGSIVFHSDWDEFPILFYHNHNNYYIVGLDPTFMYNYDQELYWKWANITLGNTSVNLHKIIKEEFKADYVYLTQDHTAMDENIRSSSGFKLIYEDEEAKIYKVL